MVGGTSLVNLDARRAGTIADQLHDNRRVLSIRTEKCSVILKRLKTQTSKCQQAIVAIRGKRKRLNRVTLLQRDMV